MRSLRAALRPRGLPLPMVAGGSVSRGSGGRMDTKGNEVMEKIHRFILGRAYRVMCDRNGLVVDGVVSRR